MGPYREEKVIEACRVLFGEHVQVTTEFLLSLKPDGVRGAYRKRAWESHPDAAAGAGDQARRTHLFRRAAEAYELLSGYLRERKAPEQARRVSAEWIFRPDPTPRRAPDERYYSGPLPTGELKIGLFMYYRGAVSFQALVRSLLWQRNQRPPLGELACKWGWLPEHAVPEILKSTHIVGRFGERAVKLGHLTDKQLSVLVFHQRSLQQPIGRYFTANGVLNEAMLHRLLRECSYHNKQVQAKRRQEPREEPPR